MDVFVKRGDSSRIETFILHGIVVDSKGKPSEIPLPHDTISVCRINRTGLDFDSGETCIPGDQRSPFEAQVYRVLSRYLIWRNHVVVTARVGSVALSTSKQDQYWSGTHFANPAVGSSRYVGPSLVPGTRTAVVI